MRENETIELFMDRLTGNAVVELGYFDAWVAEYALANELGDEKHHKRSFFRPVLASQDFQLNSEAIFSELIAGGLTKENSLIQLGAVFKSLVDKFIREGQFRENDPKVVKTKGENTPLLRKGQSRLISEIEARIKL